MIFPVGTWHGENLRPLGGSINFTPDVLRVRSQLAGRGKSPLPFTPITPVTTRRARRAQPSAWPLDGFSGCRGWTTRSARRWPVGQDAPQREGESRREVRRAALPLAEWYQQHTDRRTGSVEAGGCPAALLNDPFFNSMPGAGRHNPESRMDKLIAAALGLPETATDEQINAKAA